MIAFDNAVEAKQFFISRIVAEAVRENAPLSDLEKRTLYFTETGSDAKQEYLDDVAQLEDQYDDWEYEEKVTSLLKKAHEYGIPTVAYVAGVGRPLRTNSSMVQRS